MTRNRRNERRQKLKTSKLTKSILALIAIAALGTPIYAQVSKETLESITTPDKGKGGKYLVLPPGYQGDVPDGYFVVRSNTYTIMFFMRASIAKGHGKQLAADHPGKELVRHPPRVRPAAALDRQDLAAGRGGTG